MRKGIAPPHTLFPLTWQRLLLAILSGLLLVGGVTYPAAPATTVAPVTVAPTADIRRNARVFDTVCRLVEHKYYDPQLRGARWEVLTKQFRHEALAAPDEATLYRVINRLLAHLQDRHTFAISPKRVREEKQGTRVGIGLQLRQMEGRWVITRVLGGSAAQEAGLRPGWLIVEMDGRPFDGFSAEQSFQIGQSVRFKLLDANDHPKRVEVVCRPFTTMPEQQAQLLPGGVLYLRFSEFAPKTAEWLEQQLQAHPQATALIFDLRNNTGGLLDILGDSLRLIYPQHVVFGDFIQRSQKLLRLAITGHRRAFTGTVLVLTDEYSTSAAEIFAAAIQETRRGLVIGRRTAGAVLASVQESLPDGGKVQISIRDYRTAHGIRLEGRGVTPDVVVNLTLQDVRRNVDVDLHQAIEQLAAGPTQTSFPSGRGALSPAK